MKQNSVQSFHIREFVTQTLDAQVILEEIPRIVDVLATAGVAEVLVMFGWGCEPESMWNEKTIALDALSDMVVQHQIRGAFQPGLCDLFVRDPHGRWEVRLCHEADLHVGGMSQIVVNLLAEHWHKRGFKLFARSQEDLWFTIRGFRLDGSPRCEALRPDLGPH